MVWIIEDSDINKIKVKDKEVLIMDTAQHIFQTPWTTKLKFEEQIIRRALDIIDEEEQLKLLQQDIRQLVNEVKFGGGVTWASTTPSRSPRVQLWVGTRPAPRAQFLAR